MDGNYYAVNEHLNRQKRLLREANQERLARQVADKAPRPGTLRRLISLLALILVR